MRLYIVLDFEYCYIYLEGLTFPGFKGCISVKAFTSSVIIRLLIINDPNRILLKATSLRPHQNTQSALIGQFTRANNNNKAAVLNQFLRAKLAARHTVCDMVMQCDITKSQN